MYLDIPVNATATIRAAGSAIATFTTTPTPVKINTYKGKIPEWSIFPIIMGGILICMGVVIFFLVRSCLRDDERHEAELATEAVDRDAEAIIIDPVEQFENFSRVLCSAVRGNNFGNFQPAKPAPTKQPSRPRSQDFTEVPPPYSGTSVDPPTYICLKCSEAEK